MNVTSPADVCKNLKVFGGVFFFFDLIITFRISKHVSVSDIKKIATILSRKKQYHKIYLSVDLYTKPLGSIFP